LRASEARKPATASTANGLPETVRHPGANRLEATRHNGKVQTEPDAIERRGDWLVLGADSTGKRLFCRCVVCSHTCQIGAEALESGVVVCAGCARPQQSATPTAPAADSSFAANVAALESLGARKRHRGAT
jgi:hypothetical protein